MTTPDLPGGYWHDTERQIAISNHRDRQSARSTNAHFLLHDAVPFGTPPTAEQPAPTPQEANA